MRRSTRLVRQFVANKKRGEPYDVYVGRPSKFGNPFVIGRDGNREDVVRKFEEYLLANPELLEAVRRELRGKRLGCFCAPQRCHAHVLAWYANGFDRQEQRRQRQK